MSKHKADHVAPKENYKAGMSAKKGSSKPNKAAKHSKPQATKKADKSGDSRDRARLSFYKAKGLKVD